MHDSTARRPRTRIFLWSAPRSVSTAFEHSVCSLPGVRGFHEPFSSAYYLGEEKISPRYRDDADVEGLRYADILIRLDQDYPDTTALFVKDMAYAIDGDLTRLPAGFTHSLLIRDPRRSVSSLWRILESGRVAQWRTFVPREVGYEDLNVLYDHASKVQETVAVVDAEDLLAEPAATLERYCATVGLEFDPSMLSWKPGKVSERWSEWGVEWYETLMGSTGFERRPRSLDPPSLEALPAEVREAVERAMPLYRRLRERRLKPG